MTSYSKVCDAADWFRPEVQNIIETELREPARFHRKQWEFAMLFRALRGCGVLGVGGRGLSMGGGTERLLYSLVNHVSELVVTDLYDPGTTWDCARTGDPAEFVRSAAPFPVDLSRLTALRADMRDLPFSTGAFDFCYSTCAVEHIGTADDFRRHFEEVYRVLKNGGVYAFTTEFHYGPETIADPENYVFSWDYLRDLLDSSPFRMEESFDARIVKHSINDPRPPNIHRLMESRLHVDLPHIQLLRGRYPFTAALFVLRKVAKPTHRISSEACGLGESIGFLEERIGQYTEGLNKVSVRIDPFSSLPHGVSPWFADHAAFFSGASRKAEGITAFHTDYFWWGTGQRTFRVSLGGLSRDTEIELRIHAYKTLASREIQCIASRPLSGSSGECEASLSIETDKESCYAILGNATGGFGELSEILVESSPGQGNEVEMQSMRSGL